MSDSEEEIVLKKTHRAIIDSSSDNHSSDEEKVVQSPKSIACISQNILSNERNILPKATGNIPNSADSENDDNSQRKSDVSIHQTKSDSSDSNSKRQTSSEKQPCDEVSKAERKRSSKKSSESSDSEFESSTISDAVVSQNRYLSSSDYFIATNSLTNLPATKADKTDTSSVDSNIDVERSKKSTNETVSYSVDFDINSNKNKNGCPMSKPKKYKLLSDEDLSDDESNDTHRKTENHAASSDDSTHENLKTVDTEDRKKQIRKKRSQKLNDLKRMEIEKTKSAYFSHGSYSSDSNNEQVASKTVKSRAKILTKKKKKQENDIERNSSRSSSSSGSEKKFKRKTDLKSQKSTAKRKQQIDPMLEIKSKTQKMIREKRVSLPYHQPKKRSLDEFLQRRKNIPSMPLKPTASALALVDEHLAQREEESALFFKSDSDHTDTEEAEKTISSLSKHPTVPDSSSTKSENTVVEDTGTIGAGVEELNLKNNTNENLVSGDESSSRLESPENGGENFANPVIVNDERIPQEGNESIRESDENTQSITNLVSSSTNVEIAKETAGQNTAKMLSNGVRTYKDGNAIVALTEQEDLSEKLNHFENSKRDKHVAANDVRLADSEDFKLEIQHLYPETELEVAECPPKIKKSAEQKDCENFELEIQDSCPDTIFRVPECPVVRFKLAKERKIDLRNHKLALLSRLNVPLRQNVKLNVEPGMVIELGETPPPKPGILELQKKFADHTTIQMKDPKKEAIKLSIINAVKGSSNNVNDATEEIVDESELENELERNLAKPGLKYAFFKEKLKKTLVSKKQAQWKEYQMEKEKLYEPSMANDDDIEDFGVNRKPNFEPYHPEEEPDDNELEEDDIVMNDKEKKKNKFVDDEAEVSYDEDENIIGLEEEDSDFEEGTGEEKSSEDETENEIEEDDRKSAADEEAQNSGGVHNQALSNAAPNTKNDIKKPPIKIAPIFKYNMTVTDLENKVLGLECIFTQKEEVSNDFTESQAFELCSGKFATQRERLNLSGISEAEFLVNSQIVEDSQNINLTLEDTEDGQCNDEANVLLERSAFLLSDESDTEELFARKKKLMRIEDSDDDVNNVSVERDGGSENSIEENEVQENAENDDETDDEVDIDKLDEIGYNSEEEIITKANAAEFFENEAELSESDWGSDDENEKDLDELEKEAGDEDEIDQEKLKEELGKIHMRQMLDDDQNDVRMLQEMLLEDGELHSDNKRERKFQWKGLDDNGFFLTNANDSDEEPSVNDENDEQDEQWRKVRHEREMYISQQEKKDDLLLQLEDDDSNSVLLTKFPNVSGSSILHKSNKKNQTGSLELKHPLHSKFKCGSFLSRSKVMLNRIAMTVCESKETVVGGPKNHRNFVFATVSPEKELPDINLEKTEKRKISSKSVMASKKLKLSIAADVPIKKLGLLSQLSQTE